MKLLRLGTPPASQEPVGAQPAFDPEDVDFTVFLGSRLGVSTEVAAEVLGDWLQTYEPQKRR